MATTPNAMKRAANKPVYAVMGSVLFIARKTSLCSDDEFNQRNDKCLIAYAESFPTVADFEIRTSLFYYDLSPATESAYKHSKHIDACVSVCETGCDFGICHHTVPRITFICFGIDVAAPARRHEIIDELRHLRAQHPLNVTTILIPSFDFERVARAYELAHQQRPRASTLGVAMNTVHEASS